MISIPDHETYVMPVPVPEGALAVVACRCGVRLAAYARGTTVSVDTLRRHENEHLQDLVGRE